MTELQGQLAARTQRVEALEAELQGLRQLLGQDAEESEAETCTLPSPNMVDSPGLCPRPRKRKKLKPCRRCRRLLMAMPQAHALEVRVAPRHGRQERRYRSAQGSGGLPELWRMLRCNPRVARQRGHPLPQACR